MSGKCLVFGMNDLDRQNQMKWHPARWWRLLENEELECRLCPHRCRLKEGQRGVCRVRINQHGQLFSQVWGKPIAVHVDPIEKKPLYHFLPGSWIFSIGTAGCNLRCEFCQNWDISTADGNESGPDMIHPADLVQSAVESKCRSIAFTYNEPTIFAEYVFDIATLAHQAGLKTVMVTNGYISIEALKDIYPLIDAANIDLKAMNAEFYRKQCRAELAPVLDAIVAIRQGGTWVELTTLLIPDLNDSEPELNELCGWIVKSLGADTPLHFSAFHPAYKMTDRPRTAKTILDRARKIALRAGLYFVYEGNVLTENEADTFCPACGKLLISRQWNTTLIRNLNGNRCECGQAIPVIL